MGTKILRIAFASTCLAAVAATVFVPDLRVSRELAAARREGLWTSADDIRKAIGNVSPKDNAAPLVAKAIAEDRTERHLYDKAYAHVKAVAEGSADASSMQLARKKLPELSLSLARWREVSRRPRLDYGRHYEDGYRTLFPELAPIKGAATRLVAAAALGHSPRENLLAAARLSALVRQEPGVIQQLVGVEIGKLALRNATQRDLGPEVAAALGPAPDVRSILGPELPGLIDTFSIKDYEAALTDLGVKHSLDFRERLSHWGPMAKGTTVTGIARWRKLWAQLPSDGTDLMAAAKVVDAEMPAIDALTPSISEVMIKLSSTGGGRGDMLRDIAKFDAERRQVRSKK